MLIVSYPLFFLLLAMDFPLSVQGSETSDEPQVPNFVFSWPNDNSTFQAGDVATITIKVLGYFNSKENASLHPSSFSPIFIVNGKVGNSSLVSGVILETPEDTENWKIKFIPIRVGLFNILITEDPFKVFDSSLHFDVFPGTIYQSICVASWMNMVNEFDAGAVAAVLIQPKDAFGNSISGTDEDLSPYNFTLVARYLNGSLSSAPNITRTCWNEMGSITMEYIAVQAGTFLLEVLGGNETLSGSPLSFKVNPGPLDVSNSMARLKFDIQSLQVFSVIEVLIYQQDRYGNLVSGSNEFDVDVVERETNLSLPISDLLFDELESGIKKLSYALLEPGNFLLSISDAVHNQTLSNSPIPYRVFIGYCDATTSTVEGSGRNDSVAGETSSLSVNLNDVFQYPSFVEVQGIQVQIIGENGDNDVHPLIYPIVNESTKVDTSPAPAPSLSKPADQLSNLAAAFNVGYTLKKSGTYEIYIFCGNILLNNGHPFQKNVISGEVNVPLSRMKSFPEKISKHTETEIVIELVDSFSNSAPLQSSRLKLEVLSGNLSMVSVGSFKDYNNGTYSGYYTVNEVGTFQICVSFDLKHLSPCPVVVRVYSEEYFPRAIGDQITAWEDESVAFDVLANDYFAGGNASILHVAKPSHGSLLQYGFVFRYTPRQDFHGNDSFAYTISDVNGNLASAIVDIAILNSPPQFVSLPTLLLIAVASQESK